MPNIVPFKAVRPSRDKASLVTSRPYEDYGAAELAAQLDFNPYSFLHILHPGFVNVQKEEPQKRFGNVRDKYHEFKHSGILLSEEYPMYYLYETKSGDRTFTGIIGGISLEDYRDGNIKRHEDTLEYRVAHFSDYLEMTGFNTEPVLISYPEKKELADYIAQKKNKRPLYHFSSPNKDLHTLWRIKEPSDIELVRKAFSEIPSLYIADGHHRIASANELWERHPENTTAGFVMGFMIAEPELHIYEYNRLIRNLEHLDKAELLHKLEASFVIENHGRELWKPTRKGQFGMYMGGEFFALSAKKNTAATDADLLNDVVFSAIFQITDLRNSSRIEYLPGNVPITKIIEKVDSGEFAVGFSLFPIAFETIRAVADRNEILPPKSTYIEPKFRNGLVIYEL
ncbi:DUF1015 domain-containing protein [Flavobacterium silvaticum]|uniref:DUF1015 domain-containing protein n=1 Tax=Flavobacterium silvaticum TaxID=1852020 RepID=A0A972FV54_9FLAO|nr:DUF1015 domain-containing protein [Flavobacterium silvaticum]NMH29108.1 DUF1015 domain-containing protein [Flavobacterium silvaticum]